MKFSVSFLRVSAVAAAAASSMSAQALTLLGLNLPLFPDARAISALPTPTPSTPALPTLDLSPLLQPVNLVIGTVLGAGVPNPTNVLPNLTSLVGPTLNPLLAADVSSLGAPQSSLIDLGLPQASSVLPSGVPNGIPGILSVSDSQQGLTVGVLNSLTGSLANVALGANGLTLPVPGQGSLLDLGLPGVASNLPAGVPAGIPGVLTVSDSRQGINLGVLNGATGSLANVVLGGTSPLAGNGLPTLPALPGVGTGTGSTAGSLVNLGLPGVASNLPAGVPAGIPGVLTLSDSQQGITVDVLNGVTQSLANVGLAQGGFNLPTPGQGSLLDLGLPGVVNNLPAGVPNGIPGVLTLSDSQQGITVGVLNSLTGTLANVALFSNEASQSAATVGVANVTAVPEASTYLMMGLGLVGIAAVARRRRA